MRILSQYPFYKLVMKPKGQNSEKLFLKIRVVVRDSNRKELKQWIAQLSRILLNTWSCACVCTG